MAPKNSMKKSERPAAPANSLDLELPDWSGMDDSAVRLTPEAAFRLCEQYPRLLANGHPKKGDREEKCMVEFVL